MRRRIRFVSEHCDRHRAEHRHGEHLDLNVDFAKHVDVDTAISLPMYEGAGPAPGISAGFTVARVADGVDSDDNSVDWAKTLLDTPGAPAP